MQIHGRVALLIVLALLVAAPAFAKGPPGKATISGPGIQGDLEITDPAVLNALSFYSFEQVEENNRRGIEAPTNIGEGYRVVRYTKGAGNYFKPWDELRYYPYADGERGVIFLDGLIGDSYSEFDGKWFHANPEGDATLRAFLAQQGVALAPPTLPATGSSSLLLVVALGLAAGLAGAGGFVRIRLALQRNRPG